ncbi:unnamed protein product [Peniophora sp. CBMAI 1063]|nr:unnamed protein product [Peniophora sp. CBMAI 1063]
MPSGICADEGERILLERAVVRIPPTVEEPANVFHVFANGFNDTGTVARMLSRRAGSGNRARVEDELASVFGGEDEGFVESQSLYTYTLPIHTFMNV